MREVTEIRLPIPVTSIGIPTDAIWRTGGIWEDKPLLDMILRSESIRFWVRSNWPRERTLDEILA